MWDCMRGGARGCGAWALSACSSSSSCCWWLRHSSSTCSLADDGMEVQVNNGTSGARPGTPGKPRRVETAGPAASRPGFQCRASLGRDARAWPRPSSSASKSRLDTLKCSMRALNPEMLNLSINVSEGTQENRYEIGNRSCLHAGSRRHDGSALRSRRSEEHPSELQSLMRITYAVFCLNKT